jgi:uncharacterized membrane protein
MQYGLFVITFEDETKATEALGILKNLAKHKDINLKRAATVVHNQDDSITIKETHDFNFSNKTLGVIAGVCGVAATVVAAPLGVGALLFGAAMGVAGSGAAMGADLMIDLGFKDSFLDDIGAHMPVGCSAIVALAGFSHIDTAMEELHALEGGKIIQHTLSPEIYEKLTKTLEHEEVMQESVQ